MTTTKRPKFKVQLIIDGGRWPYVGNAYQNSDGTFTIYLDRDVELTGGRKLRIRPAFGATATATRPAPAAPPATLAPDLVEDEPERMPADHPPAHMMF